MQSILTDGPVREPSRINRIDSRAVAQLAADFLNVSTADIICLQGSVAASKEHEFAEKKRIPRKLRR